MTGVLFVDALYDKNQEISQVIGSINCRKGHFACGIGCLEAAVDFRTEFKLRRGEPSEPLYNLRLDTAVIEPAIPICGPCFSDVKDKQKLGSFLSDYVNADFLKECFDEASGHKAGLLLVPLFKKMNPDAKILIYTYLKEDCPTGRSVKQYADKFEVPVLYKPLGALGVLKALGIET